MRWILSGKQEVYLEIAERYRNYITLGVIKFGEKLPSVRELASEISVNPNTVARAYSKLEEEGYIRTIPKKGVFANFGDPDEELDTDKKELVVALKQLGIKKRTLLKWVEEVYGEDDRS